MKAIKPKINADTEHKLGDIVCYILLPTDLPSLREPNGKGTSLGGKVAAHSHHAGVQMMKYADHPDIKTYIDDGIKGGADFFNTTITLDCTVNQLNTAITIAKQLGYACDKVIDPSYPFFVDSETAKYLDQGVDKVFTRDGKTLCCRKQVTCGWIVGDKANDPIFSALVANFSLAK